MKTRREWIDWCLTFPDAYEDYPFEKTAKPGENWAVLRHSANKKSFALFYEQNSALRVNLKCDPMYADLLRSVYESVLPGYHMNHRHWNTVLLDGSIPEEEICNFIRESYRLTKPGTAPKKKKNISAEQ